MVRSYRTEGKLETGTSETVLDQSGCRSVRRGHSPICHTHRQRTHAQSQVRSLGHLPEQPAVDTAQHIREAHREQQHQDQNRRAAHLDAAV